MTEVEFYKNTATTSVTKVDNRYEVLFDNQQSVLADAVVLAVPNQVVRNVLKDKELDNQLLKFTNASAITMYLGFDVPDLVLPADGTGFIVSHNSDLVCNASTWTSRKWKHTSANGNLLIRLFYKNNNPRYEELVSMSKEELTQVALNDVRLSLNIEEKPIVVNVEKWIDAMPRYDLAHNEALQVVLAELESKYPNLFIAGCSYFGVGIGACIENGKNTAQNISKILLR